MIQHPDVIIKKDAVDEQATTKYGHDQTPEQQITTNVYLCISAAFHIYVSHIPPS